MLEASSYDYAVLRAVPHVEREEFINVGVILFCRTRRYLDCRIALDRERLAALSPNLDADALELQLEALERVCRGGPEAGPIGQLSLAERFHWLVSPRSTVLQVSSVHCGLCLDPRAALENLFQRLVLPQANGAMDLQQVLALYDRHERIEAEFPRMRREATPYVVRHVALVGKRGMVLYSALEERNLDAVVREQVAHFEDLGQGFEWKVYDHDSPPDLKDRLVTFGFEMEDPEAIVVLDLAAVPDMLLQPVALDVRRITDPDRVRDILKVQEEVWEQDESWLVGELSETLRSRPQLVSIYAAYAGDKPVCSAWLYYDERSPFASLWGGSTLLDYRGQGYYTALVSTRVQEAICRGARYLTVDASPMSQPILERFGFRLITRAHPRHWRVKHKRG